MSNRMLMWIGCGVMLAAGAFFLWSRGYTNILGYGMLLLCPLMHLVMHRGHGHGHGSGSGSETDNNGKGDKPACH